MTTVARLTSLFLGVFLGNFALNAATVAIPAIDRDLHASSSGLELVVASYGIAFAVLLIVSGRLGDRYGRRRLFGLGMLLFALASVAIGFAPDIPLLIAARIVQGIAAALATPQVLATIQATTGGTQRVRAVALFSAAGGLGSTVGQVAGGAIIAANLGGLTWRPVFWLGALIAVIAFCLLPLVPKTSGGTVTLDGAGTVLLGVGVLGILLPLSLGPAQGWPGWCTWSVLIGVVALGVLVLAERRMEARGGVPLLPPSVLALPALRLGLVMTALFFVSYMGMLSVFVVAIQTGLHAGPLEAGLSVAPFALAFIVGSMGVRAVVNRLGRRTILLGASLQIIALVSMTVLVLVSWGPATIWVVQPSFVLLGIAQALVFSPLVENVLEQVPRASAGLSGGLFTTTQQLAIAIGVVVFGLVNTALTALAGARVGLAAVIALDGVLVAVILVLAVRLGRVIQASGTVAHEPGAATVSVPTVALSDAVAPFRP